MLPDLRPVSLLFLQHHIRHRMSDSLVFLLLHLDTGLQDISKAVEAVLGQMNGQHAHHGEGHVCRCNKNKMTLKLANALIEKVKAYAQEMGVNVVIAVSDQAGRPVAVQCMDDAYIASFDIALNKTFSSASLKMSTEEICIFATTSCTMSCTIFSFTDTPIPPRKFLCRRLLSQCLLQQCLRLRPKLRLFCHLLLAALRLRRSRSYPGW